MPGQVVIAGGTFDMLAGSSDSVPIQFKRRGGILELHSTATAFGAISGLVSGNSLLLAGTSVSSAVIGASSITVTTSAGTYDLSSVSYAGPITGYIAWADPVGMELVTFTDGNLTTLTESNWTVYLGNSQVSLTGGGNTIDFNGPSWNAATFPAPAAIGTR